MKVFFKITSFVLSVILGLSFCSCQATGDEIGSGSGTGVHESSSDSSGERFSDTSTSVGGKESSKPDKEKEPSATTKPNASKPYTIKGYLLSASTPADTYGNGMFLVYKLSDGRLLVYDGGNGSVKNFMLEALQEIAGTKKVKVAAWVMTHDHGDHYGALIEYYYANAATIKDVLEVEGFWMNPMNSEGYGVQNHLKTAFPNAKMRRLTYGEEINLDKIKINVICTPEVIPPDSRNDVNTNSLVMMLTIGGKKILMTGDANEPAWEFMIKQQSKGSKYSLKCDYLQVPHHGVHAAGTAEGYAAAAAKALVIPSTVDLANKLTTSSNAKPSYDLYRSHGINIGNLNTETNNSTYWFAGCYGKSGTTDIKCFFTYNGKTVTGV
jgi:beta-lactamase superfamily II metal-dependent hydrolase